MDESNKIKIIATNRKANFQYSILKKYEAGIVLLGTEVKSLRDSKVNLQESYAKFKKDGLWLMNCHISEYKYGNLNNHEPLLAFADLPKEKPGEAEAPAIVIVSLIASPIFVAVKSVPLGSKPA